MTDDLRPIRSYPLGHQERSAELRSTPQRQDLEQDVRLFLVLFQEETRESPLREFQAVECSAF